MGVIVTDSMRRFVAKLIKARVLELREHPYDINNGGCVDFADDIINRINTVHPGVAEIDYTDNDSYLPGHAWIVVDGLCFDAEEPWGVKDYMHLPIMARALRNLNGVSND